MDSFIYALAKQLDSSFHNNTPFGRSRLLSIKRKQLQLLNREVIIERDFPELSQNLDLDLLLYDSAPGCLNWIVSSQTGCNLMTYMYSKEPVAASKIRFFANNLIDLTPLSLVPEMYFSYFSPPEYCLLINMLDYNVYIVNFKTIQEGSLLLILFMGADALNLFRYFASFKDAIGDKFLSLSMAVSFNILFPEPRQIIEAPMVKDSVSKELLDIFKEICKLNISNVNFENQSEIVKISELINHDIIDYFNFSEAEFLTEFPSIGSLSQYELSWNLLYYGGRLEVFDRYIGLIPPKFKGNRDYYIYILTRLVETSLRDILQLDSLSDSEKISISSKNNISSSNCSALFNNSNQIRTIDL